jgi:ribosomal protein S4E
MDRNNLSQAFLNREAIAGITFQHNDYVRVIDGAHAGKNGSLVSLIATASEPRFLVELEQGTDAEIAQSQLRFISHDTPDRPALASPPAQP